MIIDFNKEHIMTPGGKIVQVLDKKGEYDRAATEAEAAPVLAQERDEETARLEERAASQA